jgi:hypothetical protein
MSTLGVAPLFPVHSLAARIAEAVPTLDVEQVEAIIRLVDDARPEDCDCDEDAGYDRGYEAGHEEGVEALITDVLAEAERNLAAMKDLLGVTT